MAKLGNMARVTVKGKEVEGNHFDKRQVMKKHLKEIRVESWREKHILNLKK